MPRWVTGLLALLAIWSLSVVVALADSRVALVIGNSAYQHVTALPNPTQDSADMAAALRSIGFSVKELANAGKNDIEAALSDFSEVAAGADFAIIYFAGHGIEVNHQNYLIPTDAKLATDRRLRFEAISLDDVLGTLEDVEGIRMVLLDACRNNPFAAAMKMTSATRSVGRGFSPVEAAVSGTVISYSAKAGTVAADGTGRNSPFAAALLANITTPGLEINRLLRRVRDQVLNSTNKTQEPFISASLPAEDVFLVPPPVGEGQSGNNNSATATGGNDDIEQATDLEFWQSVKDSPDSRLLKAYIDKFPNGTFAALAHARMKALEEKPKVLEQKAKKPVAAKPSTTADPPKKTTPKTTTSSSSRTTSPAPGTRCRDGNMERCRELCREGKQEACQKLQRRKRF